jgi:flagellar basal body-associated protein FliL
MDNVTWPEAIVVLGIIALIIFLIGGGMATYLDMRKMKVTAQQEDDLRQLVRRYEQLAENSLDAQQRAAADVSELRSRTAWIEQILRTVE